MASPPEDSSPTENARGSNRAPSDPDDVPNTNFPRTFQDFFASISDNGDDLEETSQSTLETKHLLSPTGNPTESSSIWRRFPDRQWTLNKRVLRKRRNELHTKTPSRSEGKPMQPRPNYSQASTSSASSSPRVARRRRSSNAAANLTVEGFRFPTTEQPRHRLNMKHKPSAEHCRNYPASPNSTPTRTPRSRGQSPLASGSSRSRGSNSSNPSASPRHRPMLADTRRHEPGVEYYRLRSFSITPDGVFNLGDSFRPRRSRSAEAGQSTTPRQSASPLPQPGPLTRSTTHHSTSAVDDAQEVPIYRVAMLGAAGVGKTTLSNQFTTSEYTCAYDLSLDDEYGQKTVSVMLNGQETELEIIDHPSAEMSIESFCATYVPDICVVVYSIDDLATMKIAEDMIGYLWKSDYSASIGVILVGNKADLERSRVIPASVGRKLADECRCKFIETSSGLDHNVDELLVGILAQVSLNPKRRRYHFQKKSRFQSGKRFLKSLLTFARRSRSCEDLLTL